MPKYTISELYEYYETRIQPVGFLECFLGGSAWYDNRLDPSQPDIRPDYIKAYADVYGLDAVVANKYGDWFYNVDCDTVANAWSRFIQDNEVFRITHNTELSMIYKAFTTDFNPLENYDRIESSQTDVDASSGANSKVAPDNAETFYNTGNAESTSDSTTVVSSRIHGNIGVTQATDMLRNTVEYFNSNAYINVLIDRIISDNCYMIDNGVDII